MRLWLFAGCMRQFPNVSDNVWDVCEHPPDAR